MSLFLVKNIFSFLLSLFSVVFMFTYPLEPSQVSLISMFTIGIPAFFLALEPNKNIIVLTFRTNNSESTPGSTYRCIGGWSTGCLWKDIWSRRAGYLNSSNDASGNCRIYDPL